MEEVVSPIFATLNCIEHEGQRAFPSCSAGIESRCSQNGQSISRVCTFAECSSLSILVFLIPDSDVDGVLEDVARQASRPVRTITIPERAPRSAEEISNGNANPSSLTDD